MGTAQQYKVRLPVVLGQKRLLLVQMLLGDGNDPLGLTGSEGPFQIGGIGGDPYHVEDVYHTRHVELSPQSD